jgi:hypothetical protein
MVERIQFYTSKEEKKMIYKDAEKNNMGISAFINFLYTFYLNQKSEKKVISK